MAQPRVIVIVNRHSIGSKFGMANLTKFPMLSISIVIRLRQRSPPLVQGALTRPSHPESEKIMADTPALTRPGESKTAPGCGSADMTTRALLVPVATTPISIMFLKSECFCILVRSFGMMPVLSCFL